MTTEPELLNERLERLAIVLDEIMPNCALLVRDALELLKEQQAEIKRLALSGEWKRMSDLPIEKDDRFECSNCGNVVHYHDRINLYTFNDYCGRCGAYNGFKFKDVEHNSSNGQL